MNWWFNSEAIRKNGNRFVRAPHGSARLRVGRMKTSISGWDSSCLFMEGSRTRCQRRGHYLKITSASSQRISQPLKMKADVPRLQAGLFSQKNPAPSSLLGGRDSSDKACLIRKRMKGKCDFNEPGNVMHLAQQLWWGSINFHIKARICVAAARVLLREGTQSFLVHGLALLLEITWDPLDTFSSTSSPTVSPLRWAKWGQTNDTCDMQTRPEPGNIVIYTVCYSVDFHWDFHGVIERQNYRALSRPVNRRLICRHSNSTRVDLMEIDSQQWNKMNSWEELC